MLVNAEGRPIEPSQYYPNMLSHWLGVYAISKRVQKSQRMPTKRDLVKLARKELTKEKAARYIERILGDRHCKRVIAEVLYSQNTSGDKNATLKQYEEWLDRVREQVKDLARAGRAGLVIS